MRASLNRQTDRPPGSTQGAFLLVRCRWLAMASASAGETVDALTAVELLRGDGQAALLFQGAGEGPADGVRLPAGGRHDLGDGRTLRPVQHVDQQRLLGALARTLAELAQLARL